MIMRNTLLVGVGLLTLASLMACGGGGGGAGGGGEPPGKAATFGFAAGPTTTIAVSSGHTGPFWLVDLELADHDDDGTQDLGYVAATSLENLYAVESMPGLGNGSFGAVYPSVAYVSWIAPLLATGDVLGLGQEGFVLANLQSIEATTGVFTTGVSTLGLRTVGVTNPRVGGREFGSAFFTGLTVGDWNGDGIDDVAIADRQGLRVVAWLSLGESGVGPAVPTALPVGHAPLGIASGDWDGDGDDDVIVALSDPGYVTFTGPLAGTVVPLATNQLLLDPVTGDFDGDGKVDVAGLLFHLGQPVRLGFLRGLGNGTFAGLVPTAPVGVTIEDFNNAQVHAGDLDGDGRTDLALVIEDRVCVFLGTPTGEFALFSDPDLLGAGSRLAVGDVDDDGDLDLVVAHMTTLVVRTLLNERL
jgi:hypothetical protein